MHLAHGLNSPGGPATTLHLSCSKGCQYNDSERHLISSIQALEAGEKAYLLLPAVVASSFHTRLVSILPSSGCRAALTASILLLIYQ